MILKETLKEIAKRQKAELALSEIGVKREKLSDISLQTSHAIVLSGIRRCGKSTLLKQISQGIGKFYYFNFDDPRAVGFSLPDFERLDDAFLEEFGASDYYFFDEIQTVEKWELFVKLLLDRRKKVVLTGSNASLLSRELGTRLTGRHLQYELFPFSYSEFLDFSKKKPSADSLKDYLANGGFPEYLMERKEEDLHELLNDIIVRDIAVRHGIRNIKALKELAIYFLSNVGKEFTYNKLKYAFNFGSANTVMDFVSYFEESYLLFIINKFDYSLKKQQTNPKKVYSIDNGLSNINSVTFSDDKGRLLENAAFMHLRKTHKEIFYFRGKKECDFIIREKGKITMAVQACYKLSEENKAREIDGLLEALNQFKLEEGIIVTYDQEDSLVENGKKIRLIPAWKWMSEKD